MRWMPLSHQCLNEVGRSVRSLAAAQPIGVQPVPDRAPVHAQLAGDLSERPSPLSHAVRQIRPKISEPQLDHPLSEAPVGGAAPLPGVQFAGELSQARVVLAARHQVATEVGEPQSVGAVAKVALLAVEDGEAAADGQAAVRWGCWWCFPCVRGAGRPTTQGDLHH